MVEHIYTGTQLGQREHSLVSKRRAALKSKNTAQSGLCGTTSALFMLAIRILYVVSIEGSGIYIVLLGCSLVSKLKRNL